MQEVDPEYEAKMVSFEMDCNDGKGEPAACHFTAEFHAAVKQDYDRAAAIYGKNCREKGYAPSCFSLGRFYCKSPESFISQPVPVPMTDGSTPFMQQ